MIMETAASIFFVLWFFLVMDRLKKNEDFKRVYRARHSKANGLLIMYVKKNNMDINRIGISVSKKVGNSVIRHRLKRQIREIARLNENEHKCGYDIVVVARNNAKDKDYYSLEYNYMNLITRNRLSHEGS